VKALQAGHRRGKRGGKREAFQGPKDAPGPPLFAGMSSAGGAVLVPLATGAVTVDKACNARLWTDRKGQEAVRDDRERPAILNKWPMSGNWKTK
jgi:hypothetical protein